MNTLIQTIIANCDAGKYNTNSADIKKMVLKGGEFFAQFAPMVCSVETLQKMTNQKAVLRLVQAINFSLSGDLKDFNVVTAYMFACVVLSKQATISFKDAHFLCGINAEESKNIKGASRARLSKFLGGAGSAGTIKSQVSRTSGKNGFFTLLNVTSKGDTNSFTLSESAKNNNLVLAYCAQLEKVTDSSFRLLQEKHNILK